MGDLLLYGFGSSIYLRCAWLRFFPAADASPDWAFPINLTSSVNDMDVEVRDERMWWDLVHEGRRGSR